MLVVDVGIVRVAPQIPGRYKTSVVKNKYRHNETSCSTIFWLLRCNEGARLYCQIYCQIRGFEGIAGDKSC